MRRKRIAITGGIGSGKSYVCSMLKGKGIDVYDCDSAAKRIIRSSDAVRKELTKLVGAHAYFQDGSLNKQAVAEFLLASEDNKRAINQIVHPAVADDFLGSGYEWMECAILYESGFDKLVDTVVVVTAPEEIRIGRIMRRDSLSREDAQSWIQLQMPQDEVKRRADFEIVNDGTLDVDRQIEEILYNIKTKHVTDNISDFR